MSRMVFPHLRESACLGSNLPTLHPGKHGKLLTCAWNCIACEHPHTICLLVSNLITSGEAT